MADRRAPDLLEDVGTRSGDHVGQQVVGLGRAPEPLVAQAGINRQVRPDLPVVLKEHTVFPESEVAHVRRNLPDPRVDAQDRHARGLVPREVEDVEERDARAPHGEIGIVLDVAVLAAEFQRVVASGHGNRIDPVKGVLDEHGRVRRQIAEADHPVVEVDVRHPLVVRQQPAAAAAEPETHLVDRGVGDDPRMTDRGVVPRLPVRRRLLRPVQRIPAHAAHRGRPLGAAASARRPDPHAERVYGVTHSAPTPVG